MSEIDEFIGAFQNGYGATNDRVKTRAAKERRANLNDRERKRVAVRTAQLNFRCSPEFKDRVSSVTEQLGCSVADMFDQALDEFIKAHQLKGGK